jgi:hypothetical protein
MVRKHSPRNFTGIRSLLGMLTDQRLDLLRDIEGALAFDDDRHGMTLELVLSGHLKKVGDLYELTPAGEKALLDNGAVG